MYTTSKSGQKLNVVSGLGTRTGTIIDRFLSEEDTAKLHDRWQDDWPERTSHRGGTETLMCKDIIEVGYGKLSKVYGPHFAKKLLAVAEENKTHVR